MGALMKSNIAVETAVVCIYELQTSDEKLEETTIHLNFRGFTTYEAKYGSYLAKWILDGNHLTGLHLKKARGMMKRYWRQLMCCSEFLACHLVEGT